MKEKPRKTKRETEREKSHKGGKRNGQAPAIGSGNNRRRTGMAMLKGIGERGKLEGTRAKVVMQRRMG